MAFLPGIQNFLRGGSSPHKQAEPYLKEIPGFGREAYNPFIQQGQEATSGRPDYARMAQDPLGYYNELASGYKPSQGYQNRLEQAMRDADATAASGGYRGTMDDQRGRAELVDKLMGEDFQSFLQNVLGIQGTGAAGIEGIIGRGFDASSNLADYLGAANLNSANSAFQSKAHQNTNKFALLNALLGAAGSAGGGYLYGQAMKGAGAGAGGAGATAGSSFVPM